MILCAQAPEQMVNELLAARLGAKRFDVWFKDITRFEYAGDYLTLRVSNAFAGEWIERHFGAVIQECSRKVTERDHIIAYSVDPNLASGAAKGQNDSQADCVAEASCGPDQHSNLRRAADSAVFPTARLEDFVVGWSNQLAFRAVEAAIRHPGRLYNPLFIHGGCGLGKTHLLHAAYNAFQAPGSAHKALYVTGEDFTNEYVTSIRARNQGRFRSRFRQVDLLLIDDVHFFANKRATQEEFLHTFSAVFESGKQIILSSDAHPKLIGHLCDHLVSRLVAGVVVRIDQPDMALRAQILVEEARKLKVKIPDPAIRWMAEHFKVNVRELKGALLRVVATARLLGEPITLSLAQKALEESQRVSIPILRLGDIESGVAIFFGVTPADLHSSRKTRTVSLARNIAMYLARKHTPLSYPDIARHMGNKNHTTVLFARRRISQALQLDKEVRWQTPAGMKERRLVQIIEELEEQWGHSLRRVEEPSPPRRPVNSAATAAETAA